LLLGEVDVLKSLGKQILERLAVQHGALLGDNMTATKTALGCVRFRRRLGFALAYDAPKRDNPSSGKLSLGRKRLPKEARP
jgi:hypothetical protein